MSGCGSDGSVCVGGGVVAVAAVVVGAARLESRTGPPSSPGGQAAGCSDEDASDLHCSISASRA